MTNLKSTQKADVNFAKKTATVIVKPGASLAEKDVVAALKQGGFGVSNFAEVKPKPKKKDGPKPVGEKGKGGEAVMVSITGMT